MISMINTILSKFGLTGCIIVYDTSTPFLIPFDFPVNDWVEHKNAEWSYVGNPGGRFKYPLFAGMGEHTITFSAFYDEFNKNGRHIIDRALMNNTGLNEKPTPYKGISNAGFMLSAIANMSYVEVIKSLYSLAKHPKLSGSVIKMNKANNIIKVSQAQSDPTPPKCILIKNPSTYYLGHITKADIKESNFNQLNYPTRLLVDIEFAVIPDATIQGYKDNLAIAHSLSMRGWL